MLGNIRDLISVRVLCALKKQKQKTTHAPSLTLYSLPVLLFIYFICSETCLHVAYETFFCCIIFVVFGSMHDAAIRSVVHMRI